MPRKGSGGLPGLITPISYKCATVSLFFEPNLLYARDI
ncbi:hypothetical protein RKLH11_520 [Rhodobacteraceae bacterium KLH11]|nr:hypothetical protein RKLH11_520 [Rhodobacteraceae bacterium KLH11]